MKNIKYCYDVKIENKNLLVKSKNKGIKIL